jgi:excisionase family DNA binding protein
MSEIVREFNYSEKLLRAVDVAEILNISRAFAYQLMQRGDIRTVFIGGARRVRPEDLRKYIEESLSPPLPQRTGN